MSLKKIGNLNVAGAPIRADRGPGNRTNQRLD